MLVSLIVAASTNNVIGNDIDLIWHLPNDMRFFKETTRGHHVIMGRKNFESIPHNFRPLPNRTNIIITRQSNYIAEGCVVVNSIEQGIELAKNNGEHELFVIGGGQIYDMALKQELIDRVYLTEIHHSFDGDTFFPKLSDQWKEVQREDCFADEKNKYDYSFLVLEK